MAVRQLHGALRHWPETDSFDARLQTAGLLLYLPTKLAGCLELHLIRRSGLWARYSMDSRLLETDSLPW